MKPNNLKPILKVYFINNQYLSSCNICLYNMPKKEAKNGLYQYGYGVQKFQLGKHKYNVNISLAIPEAEYYNFVKYGIMQNDKLSYCEVFNNREETFCLNIWLFSVKNKIINNSFKIQDDNSFFTVSIKEVEKKKKAKTKVKIKTKKKQKKPTRKFIESSSHCPAPTNFVSLSYVPRHSVKGRANLFRPYQGGSWTPR